MELRRLSTDTSALKPTLILALTLTAMFTSIVWLLSKCLADTSPVENASTTSTIINRITDQRILRSANPTPPILYGTPLSTRQVASHSLLIAQTRSQDAVKQSLKTKAPSAPLAESRLGSLLKPSPRDPKQFAAITPRAGRQVSSSGVWMLVSASAYCPCALCCDTRTERTANGTDTDRVPYGIAASPNIPLRSRVFVPRMAGYLDRSMVEDVDRWFTCDDRGGLLVAEWRRTGITRLDLRYRNHASAKAFGRKLITVFIAN